MQERLRSARVKMQGLLLGSVTTDIILQMTSTLNHLASLYNATSPKLTGLLCLFLHLSFISIYVTTDIILQITSIHTYILHLVSLYNSLLCVFMLNFSCSFSLLVSLSRSLSLSLSLYWYSGRLSGLYQYALVGKITLFKKVTRFKSLMSFISFISNTKVTSIVVEFFFKAVSIIHCARRSVRHLFDRQIRFFCLKCRLSVCLLVVCIFIQLSLFFGQSFFNRQMYEIVTKGVEVVNARFCI